MKLFYSIFLYAAFAAAADLPFDIEWRIEPPLGGGRDFAVTTEWGFFQPYYLDRDYVFREINPVISRGVLFMTHNDMKLDSVVSFEERDSWRCTVRIDTPVVAYLLWDRRSQPFTPDWLTRDLWRPTDEVQRTTDRSMDYFVIFRAFFRADQEIELGHHISAGVPDLFAPPSMYVLVFIPLTDDEFPSSLRLWPNYPNPFRGTTTIQYSVLDPGMINLEIFDVRGASVRGLVNEPKLPGIYRVAWDGRDRFGRPCASGIYFCRLQSPVEESKLARMVLLR